MNIVNNLKVPFSGTVVKNTQRHACCTKRLEATGDEIKILPLFGISEGKAEVKPFKCLEEHSVWLAEIEESGVTDTYFLSGVPTSEPLDDGIYKVRSSSKAIEDSISLSGKDFSYTQMPTLGLIDYDGPKSAENAKYHKKVIEKGLMTALHECMPELGLDDLSYIHRDSTSSGITITDENGNSYPYKSMEGIHLFFLISDGTKLQELLEYMFCACVLSGLFWVEPNRLGQGMIQTPIDKAPSKPYTPRIVAPAKLINSRGSRLKLSRSNKRVIKHIKKLNAILDVSNLPFHTKDQVEKCEKMMKSALEDFNSQPEVIVTTQLAKKELSIVQSKQFKGVAKDVARAVESLFYKNCVFGNFLLYFDGIKEPVKASTLAGPEGEEYDGSTLHDPLDPSPENKSKSIFYWNEGKNPYINCMKHSGYGLRVFAEEPLSSNEWMNRHHAMVLRGGKILYSIDKLDIGSVNHLDERIEFITDADLKKLHLGQYAHDDKGRPIFDDKNRSISKVDYWLRSDDKNIFNSIGFEPIPRLLERDYEPFPFDQSMLNTYRGFVVTPAKGDVTLLEHYILHVVANDNTELADYITKWIALMVQKPNQPGQTVLVIKSLEGTGKTLFFSQTIGSFFGRAFFETANGEQVFGKFNGAAAEAVLINLNEAVWGGDKAAEGRMKQLATDQRITVEKKFQDARQATNFAHIVITSNNSWIASVGDSNRRYVVFEMATKMPKPYYEKYAKWLKSGGREAALNYFLHEVNVTDFDPRDIPKAADEDSSFMLDQKLLSTDNMTQFMLHLLSQNSINIDEPEFGTSSFDAAGITSNDHFGRYNARCSVGWVATADRQDAILTIEKVVLHDELMAFCKTRKGGDQPDINRFGRFLKGSIAGEGNEVFATECQRFGGIYPTGKRWRLSFQGVVKALNSKLNTNLIGEIANIGDVIDTESKLSIHDDDYLDSIT